MITVAGDGMKQILVGVLTYKSANIGRLMEQNHYDHFGG